MRFEINPCKKRTTDAPPGVVCDMMELGLYSEDEFDKAFNEAVDMGLILPRHKGGMMLVRAELLGYEEYHDNEEGWRPTGFGKFILCVVKESELEARLGFGTFREWCKYKKELMCELSGEWCAEMNCEPWRDEFKLRRKEKSDYGG